MPLLDLQALHRVRSSASGQLRKKRKPCRTAMPGSNRKPRISLMMPVPS
jgi:hypothetical protein